VKVREAGREELPILCDSQVALSHKLGFEPYGLEFFQRLWDSYEPYVHYYVVSVNYAEAIKSLESLIEANEKKVSTMKDEAKIAPINKNTEAMKKEIAEMKERGYTEDRDTPLGAKFIIKQGENVWNVNMYTIKTLVNFRAAFALHRYAIEKMYHLGAKTYDFEGVSGSTDPNDYYYGLHDFKKSFGGDFLEFLGEFDAVIDEKKYKIWKKGDHLYRRVRRKLRYILNKK